MSALMIYCCTVEVIFHSNSYIYVLKQQKKKGLQIHQHASQMKTFWLVIK